MTRAEVEIAQVRYLRANQAITEFVKEHSRTLSPMLQEAAQLETAYRVAKKQLHLESDRDRNAK